MRLNDYVIGYYGQNYISISSKTASLTFIVLPVTATAGGSARTLVDWAPTATVATVLARGARTTLAAATVVARARTVTCAGRTCAAGTYAARSCLGALRTAPGTTRCEVGTPVPFSRQPQCLV